MASSSDAIVGLTRDGAITSWNAAAERMCGRAAEAAIGTSVWTLFAPAERDAVAALHEQVLAGAAFTQVETALVGAGGTNVDVGLALFPIVDPAGEIVAAGAIARDATERKSLQRKIEEVLGAA